MSPLRRTLGAFALCALATACDEPDPVDDDPMAQAAIPVVQLRSARTLSSSSGLAEITNLFSVRISDGIPPTSIVQWAVATVRLKLEFVNGRDGCLVIDTDDTSFVEVTWADRCQSLWLNIGGSIRADAELDGDSVRWTVDADDLDIAVLGQTVESKYRGVVVVDAPIDGGPVGWETERSFELDIAGGTYAVTSQARWDVDDNDCVTLDLDAELELVRASRGISAALEDEIGTVVITAEGMRRCASRCPEAGNVFLSYGQGRFLQWTYGQRDDRREIEVSTPRGEAFVARLECMP